MRMPWSGPGASGEAYDRGMAEQKAPGLEASSSPALTAPPGLQILGSESEVGLCTDGYCVLPPAVPAARAD